MDTNAKGAQTNATDAPARRILVLGSTGSIGRQTLDVIAKHPGLFSVVGLAAGSNAEALLEQAREWNVPHLGMACSQAAQRLQALAPAAQVVGGNEGLCGMLETLRPDLVVAAASGVDGLTPILAALTRGISVAIANKEPLVAAGELVMSTARRHGARLIPIDSEISAVFQCTRGCEPKELKSIWLTASGGAFRDYAEDKLAQVTPQMALAHPTWNMGPKITVDCATLANKGFEVFELKWLFGLSFSDIRVLIHHQSIIHSMVEFVDGSILAQMTLPDMRFAIQYALSYPERLPNDFPRLDLAAIGSLTFGSPDTARFPMLRLALEAGQAGASYPAALNSSNEKAVQMFLSGEIGFTRIPEVVERTLDAHEPVSVGSLDDIVEVDRWAREYADRTARHG